MQKKDNAYSGKKIFNIIIKLSFCLLGGWACQSTPTQAKQIEHYKVTPAYYHWQTRLALSLAEQEHLEGLNANKIYVKFFDIDKTGNQDEPVPIAILEVDSASFMPKTIVPTIFITNRSLRGLDETAIDLLADRLYNLIDRLIGKLGAARIPEIQIDCDWTAQTKDQYFHLLARLKKEHLPANQLLSATIRLHQLKYPDQSGIPPVDRGMLMFYNMGEVTHLEESNSILNLSTASQYIPPPSPYPLSLDIALPLFRWGVLFRDGKMIKLINELGIESLQDTSRFRQIDDTHVEVIKSTYLDGYYLYKGDQFRLESSQLPDLVQAVNILKDHFPRKSFTLAYYHLDMPIVKRFSHVALSELTKQFEKTE